MAIYEKKDTAKSQELIGNLMKWYHKNQRDLIWRKTREPYLIWISEIMAQQTRITAVLPYYERFVGTFPTLHSLAEASEDEVLKAWEGLGYYSRARNLRKTAQILQKEYDGVFPNQAAQLKQLPGIGEYTAGAIASICFGERVPAVDGNVQRVFSRIYENRLDISVPQNKKLLTDFVKELMPETETGIFNQSLMELGALVCTPKSPLCQDCPVQGLCKAFAKQMQGELPIKAAKKAAKEEEKTILMITNQDGKVLLRQRTEKLLGGLWEFYMLEGSFSEQQIAAHIKEKGLHVQEITFAGSGIHIFTHKKWKMQGYQCEVIAEKPLDGYQFFSAEEIENLAMPTALQLFRNYTTL